MVLLGGAPPVDARESGHGEEHPEHCGRDRGGGPCAPGLRKSYCNQSWMGIKAQFSSFVVEIVRKDNMKPAAWLRLHFHDCMVHQRDVYWRAALGKRDGLSRNGSLTFDPKPTNRAASENDYYFNLILVQANSDLISDSESPPRHLEQSAHNSDGFLHDCIELLNKMGSASVKTGKEANIREVRLRPLMWRFDTATHEEKYSKSPVQAFTFSSSVMEYLGMMATSLWILMPCTMFIT